LRHLEARKILFDDEGGDALGALLLVGPGVNQQNVGDRAIGDEDLAAVEDVMIAVAAGGGAHRA